MASSKIYPYYRQEFPSHFDVSMHSRSDRAHNLYYKDVPLVVSTHEVPTFF